MNSLERNAGESLLAVLNTEAALAAIPPTLWDDTGELPFPKVVVIVKQGEELVNNQGVYRLMCEIVIGAEAEDDLVNELKALVVRLILDNTQPAVLPGDLAPIHELLTNEHFHCFGMEPGGVSTSNAGVDRFATVAFSLIGFDLDRHA